MINDENDGKSGIQTGSNQNDMPDTSVSVQEMNEYGYTWEEMLPLTKEKALDLFDRDLTVYQLHEDGSETMVEVKEQIMEHEGIFGIEKGDWENERALRTMQEELEESSANKEAQLLYGDTDKYGIYQLKDGPELRDFHFAGTSELLKRGILSDDFKEIQRGNYNLVYTGELSDVHEQTQREKLEALYEKFNIDHPADYKGHSLSVSDIVVLHENGKNSAHFVDSFGFTGLPDFMRELEGIKEQEADKAGIEKARDAEEQEIEIAKNAASGHDLQKPERAGLLSLELPDGDILYVKLQEKITVKDVLDYLASADNVCLELDKIEKEGMRIDEYAEYEQSGNCKFTVEASMNSDTVHVYEINAGKGGIPEAERTEENIKFTDCSLKDNKTYFKEDVEGFAVAQANEEKNQGQRERKEPPLNKKKKSKSR